VIVRCIPLVTAAYGTRVARPQERRSHRTATAPSSNGGGAACAQAGIALAGQLVSVDYSDTNELRRLSSSEGACRYRLIRNTFIAR
jgi:hypothetical protein